MLLKEIWRMMPAPAGREGLVVGEGCVAAGRVVSTAYFTPRSSGCVSAAGRVLVFPGSVAGSVLLGSVLDPSPRRRLPPLELGPTPRLIGPVTSCRTKLENDIFSKCPPSLHCILIGQPKTW